MPTYQVTLQQTFTVKIEAKTPQMAARRASYYLGFHDDSTPADRKQNHFEIKRIDLEDSEVLDVRLMAEFAMLQIDEDQEQLDFSAEQG